MPFSFRRDSDTRPSQKSCQMAPCFFRSMRTPTVRPFSSVRNWIPLMSPIYVANERSATGNVFGGPNQGSHHRGPALVARPYWNGWLFVQESLTKTQFIRDGVDD